MFDVFLHSHQIFHLLVVAGAVVHLQGIYGMATHRLEYGDDMCRNDPSYSPYFKNNANADLNDNGVSSALDFFSSVLK